MPRAEKNRGTTMFQAFDHDARRAVVASQTMAADRCDREISELHLLAGLLSGEDDTCAVFLPRG